MPRTAPHHKKTGRTSTLPVGINELVRRLPGIGTDGITLSELATRVRESTGADLVCLVLMAATRAELGRACVGTGEGTGALEALALRYLAEPAIFHAPGKLPPHLRLCPSRDIDTSPAIAECLRDFRQAACQGAVHLIPIANKQDLIGCLALVESANVIFPEDAVAGLHALANQLGSLPADTRRRLFAEFLSDQYRELIEEADCIILRRTPEGRITFLNRFGLNFFGYDLDEILGRSEVGTIVPSTDSSGRNLEEMLHEVSTHPDRYVYNENENVRKNGERVWVGWRNRTVLDDRGRVRELICVGTDLTAHKKAEMALQSEFALRRAIENSMRPGIVVFDLDGRQTYVNRALCEMVGWTQDELLDGGPPYRFLAEPATQLCPSRETILTHDGGSLTGKMILRRKSGESFWGLTIGAPLQSTDDETIGWVVSVADLTEQERSSNRLARLNECFLHFQTDPSENIQKLVEAAGSMLGAKCTVYNRLRDGQLERAGQWGDVGCGDPTRAAAGHVCTDCVKRHVNGVWIHPAAENRPDRSCALVQSNSGNNILIGQCVNCGDEFAGTLCLLYENNHNPLTPDETKLLGVIGAAIGVEEVRNSALMDLMTHRNRLRAMTSQLALTEQRERRRVAAILHDEVGQLIATACMRLSSVSDLSDPAEAGLALREIGAILRKAAAQTRSLTSELSLHVLYAIGLSGAIGEVCDMFQERHGLNGTVETDGSDDHLGEDMKVLLFQIVRELLFNVVKHAKAKHVHVQFAGERDGIIVTVHDDGIGFAPSVRQAAGGAQKGFGLYSIDERLQHMGGTLDLQSQDGKGTTVTVAAPLRVGEKTAERRSH